MLQLNSEEFKDYKEGVKKCFENDEFTKETNDKITKFIK